MFSDFTLHIPAGQRVGLVGAQVEGMAALFTYAFDAADDAFKNADCKLYTLSDYPSLIQYALANNIIPKETESLLGEWRKNPGAWMQ